MCLKASKSVFANQHSFQLICYTPNSLTQIQTSARILHQSDPPPETGDPSFTSDVVGGPCADESIPNKFSIRNSKITKVDDRG